MKDFRSDSVLLMNCRRPFKLRLVALLALLLALSSLACNQSGGQNTEPLSVDDLAKLPVLTIDSVLQLSAHNLSQQQHYVRVQGLVTSKKSGASLFIRDETGGIQVFTPQDSWIQVGGRLDVVGIPAEIEHAIVLRDAKISELGTAFSNAASDQASRSTVEPLVTLTKVQQIRDLDLEKAKKNYPIHLQAVVTDYDREGHITFVQDQSAGIFVDTHEMKLDLEAGQFVEVEGFTGPGDFAPV